MDENELQMWWDEQAQLPLFKRGWMWWMEVGLSNIVIAAFCLAIAWFVLYGVAVALVTLI